MTSFTAPHGGERGGRFTLKDHFVEPKVERVKGRSMEKCKKN